MCVVRFIAHHIHIRWVSYKREGVRTKEGQSPVVQYCPQVRRNVTGRYKNTAQNRYKHLNPPFKYSPLEFTHSVYHLSNCGNHMPTFRFVALLKYLMRLRFDLRGNLESSG